MKKSFSTIMIFSAIIFNLFYPGCKSIPVEQHPAIEFKKAEEYNFKFTGYDSTVSTPDMDRRCYYKIYIDKVEDGRTTTGLESQKKVYEAKLSINRHLLVIEKWVLDEKKGKYVKLNNIDQPKPNFIYFDIVEDKIVLIEMNSDEKGNAEYEIEFERK